jgi:hypothetical protein
VFTMVSDLGKLKRKVDLLGSAKDTVSHRCAVLTPYSCPWETAVPALLHSAPLTRCPAQWLGRSAAGRHTAAYVNSSSCNSCRCRIGLELSFSVNLLVWCRHTTALMDLCLTQGGVSQSEPQHTVHSQGHQVTAGGAQQGPGSTTRATAGKAAQAHAGLCSSTAGGARLNLIYPSAVCQMPWCLHFAAKAGNRQWFRGTAVLAGDKVFGSAAVDRLANSTPAVQPSCIMHWQPDKIVVILCCLSRRTTKPRKR